MIRFSACVLFTALGTSFACGGTQPKQSTQTRSSSSASDDAVEAELAARKKLQKTLLKESSKLKEFAFSDEARGVKGKALAEGEIRVTEVSKLTVIELPLGDDAVRCTLAKAAWDPANWVKKNHDVLLKENNVDQTLGMSVGADFHEPYGALGMRSLHVRKNAKKGDQNQVLDFKVAVLMGGSLQEEGFPMLCVLGVPGYGRTFEKILRSFAQGLESAPGQSFLESAVDASTPKDTGTAGKKANHTKTGRHEVTLWQASNQAHAGLSWDKGLWQTISNGDAKKGGSRDWNEINRMASLTLAKGPGIVATDEVHSHLFTRPDGTLQKAYYAAVQNEVTSFDLYVEAKESGKKDTQRVHGTLKGKAYEGTLDLKGMRSTSSKQEALAAWLAAKKDAEPKETGMRFERYMPAVEASKTVPVLFERLPGENSPHGNATLKIGEGAPLFVTLDKEGSIQEGRATMGGVRVEFKRVFRERK